MTSVLWPLGVYFVLVLLMAAFMIGGSYVLGQRRRHSGAVPYEGGVESAGSARVRLSAKFYLIAMFFVVFDLEAVFIYSWAVAARDSGWPGFWEVTVFIGILVAALVYLWRVGALDWNVVSRHTE